MARPSTATFATHAASSAFPTTLGRSPASKPRAPVGLHRLNRQSPYRLPALPHGSFFVNTKARIRGSGFFCLNSSYATCDCATVRDTIPEPLRSSFVTFSPISRRFSDRVPPVMLASSGSNIRPPFKRAVILATRDRVSADPSCGWRSALVSAGSDQAIPPWPFLRAGISVRRSLLVHCERVWFCIATPPWVEFNFLSYKQSDGYHRVKVVLIFLS
jgi:hypothetical protein